MDKKPNQKLVYSDTEKENNREFSVTSEGIVSFIIEKIISLTITETHRRKTNEKIPAKCFNYLTDMIKNYLKLEFLPYDRDDYLISKQSDLSNNQITIEENNTKTNWIKKDSNIKMIQINKIEENIKDLNDSSQSEDTIKKDISKQYESMPSDESMKFDNFSQENQINNDNKGNLRAIFFDNYLFGFNDWSLMDEPLSSSIDRNASTLIKMTKVNKILSSPEKPGSSQSIESTDKKSVHSIKNQQLRRVSSNIQPIIKYDADADVNLVRLKYQNEEIKQFRIENIPEFVEDPIIREVRLEKERQIKKEEDDKNARRLLEKELAEKNNELLKRQKEYEKKPTTTDPEGNLLLIKSFPFDKLQNEFSLPKLQILDHQEKYKERRISSTTDLNGQNKAKEESNKKESNVNQNKNFFIINEEKSPYDKNKIIPKNLPNSKFGNSENIERGPFIPAGSNFDLITPEVGVKLVEGSKEKNGGRDFFKYFQKYSKYDYTNLMRETLNLNLTSSLPLINPKPGTLESKEFIRRLTMNNQDLNNTISAFSKRNQLESNMNSSSFLQNAGANVINSVNIQYSSDSSQNVLNKTNINFSGIKLTSKTGNLRTTMEKLDLIPEHDEKDMDEMFGNHMNNTNLFKNYKVEKENSQRELNSIKKLDDINLFNKTILNTSNWGESNTKMGNRENLEKTHFIKPNQKEVEREIGKSVYNSKLPRNRLPTKAIEKQNLNKSNKNLKNELNDQNLKNFNSTSMAFIDPNLFMKSINQLIKYK